MDNSSVLMLTISWMDDHLGAAAGLWCSPQFVLEGIFGLDVGLALSTRAPLAAQVLGVAGPTC